MTSVVAHYLFVKIFIAKKQIQVMNKKIAQKWKKREPRKEEENESGEAINFKTHQLSQSDAEIIFPNDKNEYNKPNAILVIQCGKEKLLVQVPKSKPHASSRQESAQKNQFSILKSVLDVQKIQYGPTGMFKGTIKPLHFSKMSDYSLQIVEFLIKETYFSRRDHYKVLKALRESATHVFLKKTLYFDQISLEVHAMMKSSQVIVKSGIIDKNTKIIFRTSCSKLTVGIQLSAQTFQLNQKKELYLQKMIEFLYVYLQRVHFFNATHRLALIFYGRCFYPQFQTLEEAYKSMQAQNTSLEQNQKFEKNFAIALQKDSKGRIFQDVYRRIIWFSDMLQTFRSFVWEKISELLFTLNWDGLDKQSELATFITKSLQRRMIQKSQQSLQYAVDQDQTQLRISPFVHKLKSHLAYSRDSNLFEAISLISEQYRHHYKFRSLTQSGNTIILLSAGTSQYDVDETSYKMAKSYIYLTNIDCSMINFKIKTQGLVKANIICSNQKPYYRQQDATKFEHLNLHCIQKQFYISPTNQDMIVYTQFCNKNFIYPDQLIFADKKRSRQLRQLHHCDKQIHYQLRQKVRDPRRQPKQIKTKHVSFINTYSLDDRYLHVHKLLYDKLHINENQLPLVVMGKNKKSEIDIFQANLDKILVTKKQWRIESVDNQINRKLQGYREFLETNKNKTDKKDKISWTDKTSKAIFKLSNYVQQNMVHDNNNKFQTSSITEGKILWSGKAERKRRISETFRSDIIAMAQQQQSKGKVNIFEQTYKNKNHEYNAGQKEENKAKKLMSHNKQRRRNLHLESNIHYIMPYYHQNVLKKLKAFIKNQYIQELKDEEDNIVFLFETQKMWKNLVFPLLTPIYTKYKQNFKDPLKHFGAGVIDETHDKRISILEDEICKLLMKNYQIQESHTGYSIMTKLSKGHVSCTLQMNGPNLSRTYIVDSSKQKTLVPNLLYRYLSYEDKDCRFCSKYIYFKDKNYFTSTMQNELQTKIVKLSLSSDQRADLTESRYTSSTVANEFKKDNQQSGTITISRRSPFQDFVKMFNEKYKQLAIEISLTAPHTKPKKKKFVLNFSKTQNRALYNHQQVQVDIDIEYNPSTLFQILISWNLCSSVIINEFVQTVMTMGRRSKLKPALLSSGNIFHTVWSITTIGQIIFKHSVSLQLLERAIRDTGQWMWDSDDYYFHITGIAFIKFNQEKKMILWRDNNHQKRNRDSHQDDSSRQYIKFFMKAAIFDFIGEIIEKVSSISFYRNQVAKEIVKQVIKEAIK